ncbi:MAG: ATP-binding protein [Candidatus Omnitrophota bacterium]
MNLKNSLSIRVVLIVFLIMTGIFAVMTIMTTSSQNKSIWGRNLEEANIISNLILNAVRYPMLTGDQDIIQRQFDNFSNSEGIDAVSLVDHLGIIKRSTDRSIIGQMSLADNLERALAGSEIQSIEKKKRVDKFVFSRLVPILNEPACYACHGKDIKVLGVLRVTLDLRRAFIELRNMRSQNVLYAVLALLAVVLLLKIFLFRTVVRPIRTLEQAMRSVAQGNLKQQIVAVTNDEIGSLTKMFNAMTFDINSLVEKEKSLVAKEQVRTEKLAAVNADLVQEIKERRKTEEKLNTAYRQFSDIIEFLPDGTFVVDRDRKVIAWNRIMEELTSVPKRDIIGKGDYIYSVPFYGAAVPMLIDFIFDPNPKLESNYELFERRGDRLFAETTSKFLKGGKDVRLWAVASPLYDNNGTLVGAIESVRDITLHRLNEERIIRAAQEWRITFDSIQDLMSIIDKDYRVVRCNTAFASAFHKKPEEVIGADIFSLYYGTDTHPGPNFIAHVFSSGSIQISEIMLPDINRYFEVTASPIYEPLGGVTGVVLIAKDITSRKELQKKERLAQLGKLVADMAHEVNNPLMIISGRAQLSLMEDIDNPEIKGNLGIIMDECQRAKDIIQRLLKFSRRGKNEIVQIDINKSIEAIVNILEHQFSLSGIGIVKKYGANLAPVWGDERQLQEVFMNLFSNAREAMAQGGTIEITTSQQADMIRIVFKDSGSGMNQEVLSRVFEPFFTTKEKGTGLGLSVCYGIIKGHGGELTFESEKQQGTAAIIQLPINRGGTDNE